MTNVKAENRIKANITSVDTVINANVVKRVNNIKSNITCVPSATTEHKGIIRIATLEEAQEGADNSIAITPYTLNTIVVSGKTYVHEQGVSSDTWIIAHNLNKYPSVTLVDSAGTQFQGRVEYTDENNCIVYMNGATKGKAYLN